MAEKTQSAGIANSLTGDTLAAIFENVAYKNLMKKSTLLLLLIFGIASCNKNYFEFDEVVHYKSQIPETNLYNDSLKSKEIRLQKAILLGNTPETINDTAFISNLENIGFKKNDISVKNHDEVNKVFAEKIHFFNEMNACIPIYNDLLIFKRKSRVVGIAKVCFTCSDSQILGTQLNTKNFGQGGDFKKLENILNK